MLIAIIVIVVLVALVGFVVIGFNKLRTTDVAAQEALGGIDVQLTRRAELIPNPSSGAPGVKMGNVYILAGVPYIAASMLEALAGKLEGGRPVVSVTVGARAAESDVADLLRETEEAHPGVAIGSYPFFKEGRYGANFVIRSEDGEKHG